MSCFALAVRLLLSIMLAWQCCAGSGSQAAAASALSTPECIVLANGLKVIILPDHSCPVVSCMSWFKVGAGNEVMGSTGLSHLVEHLLCRRPGSMRPGEVGAMIAMVGGEFNAYTSDDFTTFFELVPSYQLEAALNIEAERMKPAKFTDKDVQDEVLNINHELEVEGKDSQQVLAREVRAAAYQQHPYHNPTGGWPNDIGNLSAAQARLFHREHFRPDNATLVLVGDLQLPTCIDLVKKYFNQVPKPETDLHRVTSHEPAQRGERRLVVKSSGNKEILAIAYHAPAVCDPDAAACVVLEKLLNASYSGRLRSRLLDTKLCMSASARFEAKKDPGLFWLICGAQSGIGQQKIIAEIDSLLNQLKEQPINEGELKRARNLAEFSYLSERNGPYRVSFDLGYFDTLSSWQTANAWIDRLRAVSAADLQRAAKRCFNSDNRVIGWSAPTLLAKPTSGNEGCPQAAPADAGGKSERKASPEPIGALNMSEPVKLSGKEGLPSIQQVVTKNGIRLIVFENHLSSFVQILGAIKSGGVFEPAEKKGLAAVLTATMNIGSAKHTRWQLISQQEDEGLPPSAMIRFDDGKTTINFQTRCLPRDLNWQMNAIAESIIAPCFKEAEFEKAKLDVNSNIKRQQDVVESKIENARLRGLLSNSSAYWPGEPANRVQSINNLHLEDLISFHEHFVVPGSTSIVMAGNITVPEATALVEQAFGSWNKQGQNSFPSLQPNAKHILQTSIPLKDRAKTMVSFAQIVPLSRKQMEFSQFLLVDCLLARHPILSRLKQTLLTDPVGSNVCGSEVFHTELEPLADSCIWSLTFAADPSVVGSLVKNVQSELNELAESGLSNQEFDQAKRYLIGATLVRQASTVESAAENILQSVMDGGEPDFASSVIDSIKSSGVASVNKLIHATFKPDKVMLVVAGNSQAITSVRNQTIKTVRSR